MANIAHKNLTGTDLHNPKGFNVLTTDTIFDIDASGNTVFNNVQNDRNFTFKTSASVASLFVDGGNGYVGVGTASPERHLDVYGTVHPTSVRVRKVDDTANGAYLSLWHERTNPANGDTVGTVGWSGTNSTPAVVDCGRIEVELSAVLAGAEYSKMHFQVRSNGVTARVLTIYNGLIGIGRETPTAHIDVYDNTTGSKQIKFQNSSRTTSYGVDDTGGYAEVTGNYPFRIYTNSQQRVYISGAGQVNIGGATPSYDLDVTTTATTGTILGVRGSSLTTGSLGYFYSNSADVSVRNLVDIINDNSASVETTCLAIRQDAGKRAIYVECVGDAPALRVTGTGIATSSALQIYADSLTTGRAAYFYSNSADVSTRHLVEIINNNGGATGTDCLRIGQGSPNWALNIVPANNGVIIYSTSATTGNLLQVNDVSTLTSGRLAYFYSNSADVTARNLVEIVNDNSAAVGATCLKVIQVGGGASSAIIVTTAATTGCGISMAGDSLTTGQLASFYSNGTDANARNLVQIINDNSAASGAKCLYVQQDADQLAFYVIAAVTTYYGIYSRCDSLTTGQAGRFVSNSSNTGAFQVVGIYNDNSLATGAVCLYAQQDAANVAIDVNSTGNGAHIRFRGDPTVASPVDGDMWFTGTELRLRIGTTTYKATLTAV
jgi:hypothetical protein